MFRSIGFHIFLNDGLYQIIFLTLFLHYLCVLFFLKREFFRVLQNGAAVLPLGKASNMQFQRERQFIQQAIRSCAELETLRQIYINELFWDWL